MKATVALLLLALPRTFAQMGFFQPGEDMPCNAGIATKPCQPWDSFKFDTTKEVIIPCGSCAEITNSKALTIPKGINIQGRLRLAPPQGNKVTIRTGSVLVQGILSIYTPYAPSSEETVNIILTDRGSDLSFVAFEGNAALCPTGCGVGRRPIAVAGGRLDIKGLPDTCATWKQLQSVSTSSGTTSRSGPSFQNPKDGSCSLRLEDEKFDAFPNSWAPFNNAWLHAKNDAYGTYLETTNRHVTWQGISKHFDDDFMSCVDPGIPYLVSFSIKINGVDGAPSACATSGQRCPYVGYRRKIASNSAETIMEVAITNQGTIPRDDEWFPVTGTITFTKDDLTSEPYYRFIYFEGPLPGEAFAIDNFSIWRSDSNYFRDNECSQLITNGDAELDQASPHPHPFRPADKWRTSLAVVKESGNQFFRVTGRKYDWATLRYDIPVDCMALQQGYTFSLKARSTAKIPFETRFAFMTRKPDGTGQWNSITIERNCATGENEWAECTGSMVVDNPNIFEAYEVFIDIRTRDNQYNTYDLDFDDLDFSFSTGSAGGFIVDDAGVKDCWTPGSKLLLTSDTIYFEDSVIATIKSVKAASDGKVAIAFEEALPAFSSAEDGFPIELALLERNIKFESDNINVINQGGHLMVYHTKDVAQVIDGVELYKFGQRGNLGRYPLHMHMCSTVKRETHIKRNLIHHSNQRCTVIHGSHGVNIEGNVAYENFGHCYMLEDGGEVNNTFARNFAANQRRTEVENLVRDKESDDNPSAYWITNPMNTFIGNVAAGGEGSGFWLELLSEVKAPSKKVVDGKMYELPLTEFRDNIAHSYRSNGLRSYPSGYRPIEQAVFKNTKSYKNRGNGVFFHNSWNLKVEGGIFADNRRQIQIHRADDVIIEDVEIYGQTQSYVNAMSRTGGWQHCSSSNSYLYGVTIHSFLFNVNNDAGPTLKNVSFYNISSALTGCTDTAAIAIHDDEVEEHFDSWTKFENVNFDESSTETDFSMCKAVDEGLQDVLIEVVGGDLGSGFITSKDQIEITEFLPTASCSDLDGIKCAQFCSGACLRTLRFLVDPHGTENMVLKIQANGKTISVGHTGLTHGDSTRHTTYRVFSTILPPGDYSMKFTENEKDSWPGFVREELLAAPSCWSSADITYTLAKPPAACDVLVSDTVRNGNFESGGLKYWVQMWAGLELASPGVGGSGHAGISPRSLSSNIGQHMDTRCMEESAEYEITARVRSLDKLEGGSSVKCDPNSNTAGVRCSYGNVYSEFVDANGELNKSWIRIAWTLDSTSNDDWKVLHGVFQITEHMSKSDKVLFYIEGGPGFAEVDDVVVKKFNRSDKPIILNGDLETGDNRFWVRGWNEGLVMTDGFNGGTAITTTQNYRAIIQHLGLSPLAANKRYLFQAKFKIDGGSNTCEPETWWGTYACPKVWVDARFKDSSLNKNHGYQLAVPPYVPGQWNLMYGFIDTTQKMLDADDLVRLFIHYGPTASKVILDDMTLEEVASDCSELIVNGDGESGDARAWRRYGPSKLSVTKDANTGTYAIANTNRERNWAGLEQLIDPKCMVEGNTYKISAQIKLVKNGQPFDCKAVNRCPTVVIESRFDSSSLPTKRVDKNNDSPEWTAGKYNLFSTSFTVDSNQATADSVAIAIRNPTEFVDVYLDNISVAIV